MQHDDVSTRQQEGSGRNVWVKKQEVILDGGRREGANEMRVHKCGEEEGQQ